MRKAQKQRIIDCINSLHQAHREIKNTFRQMKQISAQAKPNIQKMLGECQGFAVSLGEYIEKQEGEGHPTVACLEEYCEGLFQCFKDIDEGNISIKKTNQVLNIRLAQVEASVKNDIVVRKEIAFFPYKASMWDSLESVYLTAKEDSKCDVYCVPIPYYELNPDRSFGQMYYEGLEYPPNIEVIDWKSYDFEERMPDEIYIHNPYDNCNLVTSVHPRFYSGNLKKYTEKLIYIPYFVLREIEPDDQLGIDGMKHFVWLPGVINADKVIVQSEKMKQIYVNEYLKEAKANRMVGRHLDKKYLRQKFLGLGSPKFDKALNIKKEDLEIPEEWMKIILRLDGSWKKIIFYNTSISGLLHFDEKWIEKIEDSIQVFKRKREDVVLLWRPHPLIENTMKCMRPELLGRYLEIKDRYLQERWGIYDDTVDMDRAIALSDAYYGDGSSVIQLYEKTGKPVMMQNVEVLWTEYSNKS